MAEALGWQFGIALNTGGELGAGLVVCTATKSMQPATRSPLRVKSGEGVGTVAVTVLANEWRYGVTFFRGRADIAPGFEGLAGPITHLEMTWTAATLGKSRRCVLNTFGSRNTKSVTRAGGGSNHRETTRRGRIHNLVVWVTAFASILDAGQAGIVAVGGGGGRIGGE